MISEFFDSLGARFKKLPERLHNITSEVATKLFAFFGLFSAKFKKLSENAQALIMYILTILLLMVLAIGIVLAIAFTATISTFCAFVVGIIVCWLILTIQIK